MGKKIAGGLASGRSITPMGVVWAGRARAMATSLLDFGRYCANEIHDGYLIHATRNGRYARGTVIDVPQMIACPSGVRVPFGDGDAVSGGLLFPAGMRDLWQAGYIPDGMAPKLPEPDMEAWRLAANAGYAFGGSGPSWSGAVTIQLSALTPRGSGYEQTVQQRDAGNVAGFYNAANPSRQRFTTRLWASSNSASRENTEANTGSVPIPNIHAASLTFSTTYADTQFAGWVAVPRATAEFTPSSPPGWANPNGVWGRAYRVDRGDSGRVRYLVLARLFDDAVYAGDGLPYFEPGAAWVAIADVVPTLADGVYVHSGTILSASLYQTAQPSRFRNPDACEVTGGVHVLLHAEVVDNLVEPNVWAGGNTYTVISAKATAANEPVSLSYATVDAENDGRQIRHFYGGVSLDGVSSTWLCPYFNDVAAESPTGLMRVLSSDGVAATLTDVATPAQFQAPGWGIPAGTGLVCDIGIGLIGFVVTLAAIPVAGSSLLAPFDVTFCTYAPDTGIITVRGEIAQATAGFVEGYPTTAGGIGAVTVVQKAIQEPDAAPGVAKSEAVLLWSTNSGSNPPNGGIAFVGATFISYDSGQSWHKISDTVGDFRGAFFIGNDLRPVRPGLAWVKPEV